MRWIQSVRCDAGRRTINSVMTRLNSCVTVLTLVPVCVCVCEADAGTEEQCIVYLSVTVPVETSTLQSNFGVFPPSSRFKNNLVDCKHGYLIHPNLIISVSFSPEHVALLPSYSYSLFAETHFCKPNYFLSFGRMFNKDLHPCLVTLLFGAKG